MTFGHLPDIPRCSCGKPFVHAFDARGATINYCEHCDEPCAGVAGPGRCEACDRMKVKR